MEDETAPAETSETARIHRFDETTGTAPKGTALGCFVGLLLMSLLILLAAVDPLSLLVFSGLLTATALFLTRRLSPVWGGVVLGLGAVAGFALGGLLSGVVVGSALVVAAAYPSFQTWFRHEDDHFFLASASFWICVAIGVGVGFLLDHATTLAILAEIGKVNQEVTKQLLANMSAVSGPDSAKEPLALWIAAHPNAITATSALLMQPILSYLAIKWVRRRLNWAHPVWSKFMLFRLGVPYSFILVAGLVLLIVGPMVSKSAQLETMAVPLLAWFGSGCLMAGLACSFFMVVSLQLAGRIVMARLHRIGMVLMLVFAPWVIPVIGLIDIWFDMRKLTFTKSMFIGKGDS